MNKRLNTQDALALHINGSLLAVGQRPALGEFDPPLRGVALSDSPVLIKASEQDGPVLVERLHALGRRRALPMHDCRSPEEALRLLGAVRETGETSPEALGTWAFYGVTSWPSSMQSELNRVLAMLDEGRLHGRLRHEGMPRVVVVQYPGERADHLDPELVQRLSFFSLSTAPHAGGGSES
jgi:hypothetical protein